MKLEEIDRPVFAGRSTGDYLDLNLAVAKTAETGRAVRLSLNGESEHKVRNRLASYLGPKGLKVRMHKDKAHPPYVVIWAERK